MRSQNCARPKPLEHQRPGKKFKCILTIMGSHWRVFLLENVIIRVILTTVTNK